MASNASRTIKSAHRVLEILEHFDQDRRHATVMDMARTLNYPQSSTSELLRCLTRLGYLHYDRFRRTYSPTARVALLGAWVKPALFRGGPVLSAIDEVARQTGETVVLSCSANYAVQYLHVIHGAGPDAWEAHGGETRSILHSPEGRLLLSSYRNEHIRSALHRLNAEEFDAERRVKVAEAVVELSALRERGWSIETEEDGSGCVSVMLPLRRNLERLAISVHASAEVIEQRGEEFLALMLAQRDRVAELDRHTADNAPQPSNVVALPEPSFRPDYHRQVA